MDHLGLPYPYPHEATAHLPVDHPDFTAYLNTQPVSFAPAAAAYQAGLSA